MALLKTEVTLVLVDSNDHGDGVERVAFGSPSDERYYLCFPRREWRDMGKPDQITVTIEPGDRLNEASGEPAGEKGQA
jgi:hypothetical protein